MCVCRKRWNEGWREHCSFCWGTSLSSRTTGTRSLRHATVQLPDDTLKQQGGARGSSSSSSSSKSLLKKKKKREREGMRTPTTGRSRLAAALASRFASALSSAGLGGGPGQARLAIAFSGGPDSAATGLLAAWWAGSGERRGGVVMCSIHQQHAPLPPGARACSHAHPSRPHSTPPRQCRGRPGGPPPSYSCGWVSPSPWREANPPPHPAGGGPGGPRAAPTAAASRAAPAPPLARRPPARRHRRPRPARGAIV